MATGLLNPAGENQVDRQAFDNENLKSPARLSIISIADEARLRANATAQRVELQAPTTEDIRDIETLFKSVEAGQYLAITENGGKIWRFAVVTGKFENTFREGLWRFSVDVDLERVEPDFRHTSRVIFTRDFETIPLREWLPRMTIRPVTSEEVAGVSFSYASQHKFTKRS